MKIVLISQPTARRQQPDFPPPGIAYLGARLKAAGHQVRLIDGGRHGVEEIAAETREQGPQFIGVTCWTVDRHMAWNLCEELKKVAPDAHLAIGGPHATVYPEHIFKKTHAFAVGIGEGEETIIELVNALQYHTDPKEVAGLALRMPDGSLFYTRPRLPSTHLDHLPLPYYDGFKNFSFWQYNGFPPLPKPTAAIISSRGCVYNCSYCASVRFWGRKWRFRSAPNVLDEIAWLKKNYRINSLYFFDDNFTVNTRRAMEICEGMQNLGLDLQWACCSHVKLVNPELLRAMKSAGCVTMDFGVESGSDKILRNVRKRQTSAEIERAFRMVHESGIQPRAYLMVGCPGEDQSTIDETIDLIGRIQPRSSIGATILWLLPGTDVYEQAVKNGHISEQYWLEHDGLPYNLQEHSLKGLQRLRNRLMYGIARKKGGVKPLLAYMLKTIFYKCPKLSVFRSLVPRSLR